MSTSTTPKPAARDPFAEIAAQRGESVRAHLVEPQPPPRPKNLLPVGDAKTGPAFQPATKLNTEAQLKQELARQRRRYARFLQNVAPALPACRVVHAIERFDWREETAADRADFASHTLAGGGAWEEVRIPHYGGPLGRAVTYYRTTFTVTTEMRAKGALFVRFRGVDYKAHVFVNGAYLGSHEGFFAPFEFEFTPHARRGRNTLVVKVENDAICMGNDSWGPDGKNLEGDKIYAATGPGYDEPDVGWHHCPPGMGIYQSVTIEARAPQHLHDLFVRPLPDEKRAEVWVEVWNCDRFRRDARLRLSVFGQNFTAAPLRDRDLPLPGPLGPTLNQFRFSIDLPQPRLWDLETPWLYQAQVTLLSADGKVLDALIRQFGMRSFRLDVDHEPRGRMYLNGRELRLRGANTMGFEQLDVMRGDWLQLIDDILLAKICNMNFLRLTQRPVQDEVYEYCDRLGLMTQSDLPLFGMLRRNQFCEAVRQAGEMERLVRAHPCNIMVSYINEPFPSSWGLKGWRQLVRHELEAFFTAADQAVHLHNPDRVIKAVDGDYDPPGPGLPDNHCYCGWYNGHGLDLGKLHRGYWQRVKPGWLYGCGEFGAEGLDFADLMRRRYPARWLPQTPEEEKNWSPSRITCAQTGRFHFMWFETQHSLEDWARASQAHQAWVTRLMTEAIRRDARLNTCAIHLFIDAFPSGWMKSIVDVDRRPKPAFFAYREALTPLMANLRADRSAYFAGETAEAEAWLCNDTHDTHPGATLAYRLEIGGSVVAAGTAPATVPACSAACQGKLAFALPSVAERVTARLRLALLDKAGRALHECARELDVFPAPATGRTSIRPLCLLGANEGKAAALLHALRLPFTVLRDAAQAPTPAPGMLLLCDDPAQLAAQEAQVAELVRAGATLLLLELPAGEHTLLGETVVCRNCGMSPVHHVSRDTGHPLVREFHPHDFRFWYDAALGYPSPLLERTFTASGWTAILTGGNGGWGGDWSPALAAAETHLAKGLIRVCNLKLAGRIAGNPVAAIFARRLLLE